MSRRMWSAAKYRTVKRHGNGTLTRAEMTEAVMWMQGKGARKRAAFLEAYPYVDGGDRAWGVRMADRVVPDFVVRREYVEMDLGMLLTALGCVQEIRASNVHVTVGEMGGSVWRGDDGLHVWLRGVARKNERALEKVALFA